jgi:hypothetical protein
VRGLTAQLSRSKIRNLGSRGLMPCVAACQMGGDFCLSGELLASRGGWPNLKGSIHHARDHYPAVSGLQEPELFDDQEQEDDDRASGDVEVLQSLPEAHGP